jgi:hypothetical protein
VVKLLVLPGPIFDQLRNSNVPGDIANFSVKLIDHILSPLMWFSLGVLIVGCILLIVSFVYRPGQPASNR